MPPRGSGKPPVERGKACGTCGADEWVREGRRKIWVCRPCGRRKAAARNKRQRQARPDEYLWRTARQRAAVQGVPFTITPADVRRAWPSDGRCPVLGLVLRAGEGKQHDESPSIDRLVSAFGYEPGNVAVISLRANRAKGDMTAAELERLAAWMRGRGLA